MWHTKYETQKRESWCGGRSVGTRIYNMPNIYIYYAIQIILLFMVFTTRALIRDNDYLLIRRI